MSGTLYVVATPIGNLEDFTPRARQILASVDLIAAEDTRHTGRLLSHFGIETPTFALHEHNEQQFADKLVCDLELGKAIALVSDAGTPLVSDPGYRLVKAAHEAGIAVLPVPGASALTAALSVAGLPTDRFCFEGFLPSRSGARRECLAALADEKRTLVFYESVHRIAASIDDLCEIFGPQRLAFIGRELTKLHEQGVRATLGELREGIERHDIPAKGEFVIAVAGSLQQSSGAVEVDRLLVELAGKLPDKELARAVAKATGEKRNALYQRLLGLRRERQ